MCITVCWVKTVCICKGDCKVVVWNVMEGCWILLRFLVPRRVQECLYCLLFKGCAINCEGLKIEHSTSYCVYVVICRWLLCSYIHLLISEKVCNIKEVCFPSCSQCRCSCQKKHLLLSSVSWTITLTIYYVLYYHPYHHRHLQQLHIDVL